MYFCWACMQEREVQHTGTSGHPSGTNVAEVEFDVYFSNRARTNSSDISSELVLYAQVRVVGRRFINQRAFNFWRKKLYSK